MQTKSSLQIINDQMEEKWKNLARLNQHVEHFKALMLPNFH